MDSSICDFDRLLRITEKADLEDRVRVNLAISGETTAKVLGFTRLLGHGLGGDNQISDGMLVKVLFHEPYRRVKKVT